MHPLIYAIGYNKLLNSNLREALFQGGSSLQNRAPRIRYKDSPITIGPYPSVEVNRIPGKVNALETHW